YRAGTYELDIVAPLRRIEERPHYRGAFELQEVRDVLPDDIHIANVIRADRGLKPASHRDHARLRFAAYVDAIRRFTVYLNTTRRSPMPRSRTEAMLCGVVPVSLANHDVESFITHGRDGFVAHSAAELAEYAVFLCRRRDIAREMGERARNLAADLFNI